MSAAARVHFKVGVAAERIDWNEGRAIVRLETNLGAAVGAAFPHRLNQRRQLTPRGTGAERT